MSLRFEWDPDKAATNERKHGVTFVEASTAFRDPHSVSVPDPDHSATEARWLLLGVSRQGACWLSPTWSAVTRFGSSLHVQPRAASANAMKKTKRKPSKTRGADEIRPEYDFSGGIRGKYAARYRAGTNVVLLDPDVAAAFATAESVNRALRALLEVVPARPRRVRRRRTA